MAVKTPSYWKNPEYQPIVEATTYYGNKVQIPESLQSFWEFCERMKGKVPRDLEWAKAAGFFTRRTRDKNKQDTMRVYYEEFRG